MSYTVVWNQEAEARLTTIWTEASDRAAVTAAATSVEKSMRVAPEDLGEARAGNRRVVFEEPLLFFFEVRPDDRIVSVISVHRFGRHA